MKLKIGYRLEPEQIQTTVSYIDKNSEKGLVKRVLEEETTFMKECKRMAECKEKEFYRIREELVDVLNHYDFDGTITENKKRLLDYKLFHEELDKLKKVKKKWKSVGWGVPSTGATATVVAALFLGGPIAVGVGAFAVWIGLSTGVITLIELDSLKNNPPKGLIAMRTYYKLVSQSKEADDFMEDYQSLKENYLPLIESSDKGKGVLKK